MIGDECSIGEQATIAPHVRVYPFKTVETGAHVQRSLIWQPRGTSTLFTDEGVTGIVNVDVTPETATRLAMAYGTTLSRGDKVVASRDAHPASRMIKRAMIAGLVATGVSAEDLRVAHERRDPLRGQEHRRAGRLPRADLRPRPRAHPDHVLRANGILASDETRKGIEKYFNRQELRRALLNQLGDLSFPPRVHGGLHLRAGVAPRRRAHSRRPLPDRARLRLLGRGAGDAGRCCARCGSSRSPPTRSSTPTSRRSWPPTCPPSRARPRGWWRRWAPHLGVVLDRAAERIVLIDEQAREIPADAALHLIVGLVAQAPAGGRAGS